MCLAHGIGDTTTTFGMLNPEVADGFIGIGQTQVSAFGMTEGGGVEVEFHAHRLAPVNPALKMFYAHLVAVNELAAEVTVDFMQVDTLRACQK